MEDSLLDRCCRDHAEPLINIKVDEGPFDHMIAPTSTVLILVVSRTTIWPVYSYSIFRSLSVPLFITSLAFCTVHLFA